MAEAQLQQFLEKVRQLNALVALSEADPAFRQRLSDCASHQEVVDLASRCGFDIARRWGEPPSNSASPDLTTTEDGVLGPNPAAGTVAAKIQSPQDPNPQDPSCRRDQGRDETETRAESRHELRVELNDLGQVKDDGHGPGPNLLLGPCPPAGQERSDLLVATGQLRLELIHSCQFASPPGFWYDQIDSEWLLLLQGEAVLRFADEAQARTLQAGDSLLISPGRRHRVEATDPAPGTRWLALFWSGSD